MIEEIDGHLIEWDDEKNAINRRKHGIDFEDAGRGKVLDFLCDKYGRNRVAHMVTFGQMAPRSAIKDVARALEYPIRKANELAGLVPDEPRMTFSRAFNGYAKFRQVYENGDEAQKKILRIAEKIEGVVCALLHYTSVIVLLDSFAASLLLLRFELEISLCVLCSFGKDFGKD